MTITQISLGFHSSPTDSGTLTKRPLPLRPFRATPVMGALRLIVVAALTSFAAMGGAKTEQLYQDAAEAVDQFKKVDPTMEKFFKESIGYVIFPKVSKGAIGIGAAGGQGVVYEGSKRIGTAKLSQISIGAQLGGQVYAEIVFFEDEPALNRFKESKVKLSAQASAVAAGDGASANADYEWGVAIFTLARSGLMFEASVGGQKFKFKPEEKE